MNREAIQELIDHLSKMKDGRLTMCKYIGYADDGTDASDNVPLDFCKTPACIAGWVMILDSKKKPIEKRLLTRDDFVRNNVPARYAQNVLQITSAQADELFHMDAWNWIGDESKSASLAVARNAKVFSMLAAAVLLKNNDQVVVSDSGSLKYKGETYHSLLRIFDLLPAKFRCMVGVKLLQNLLKANEVDWPKAMAEAYADWRTMPEAQEIWAQQ